MTETLQLLSGVNPTGLSFVELLDYRAQHQPQQLAYQFLHRGETVDTQLTYLELRDRARTIALQLKALGATGGRALLLFSPGLDFVSAFLACLYAGVTAVPAYPPRKNRKLQRLQAIVLDAEVTVVLTTADLADKISYKTDPTTGQICDEWLDADSPLAKIPWLSVDVIASENDLTNNLANSKASNLVNGQLQQDFQVTSNPLAFLQYTSGSTGSPKGVMVSQENLLHNLAAIYRCFGHTPESRGVIWLPPYHDMGLIGGILQPLYGGFPVTLMSPADFLQKPLRWLQAISQHSGTTSGGPDFAYDLCTRRAESLLAREAKPELLENLDLSSWKVAFTGAEPVRADTLNRFADTFEPYGFRREAFYPCYGMAETTLIVSGGTVERAPLIKTVNLEKLTQHQVEFVEIDPNKTDQNEVKTEIKTLVSCGQSLIDQQVEIVNPETKVKCQPGEVGEVWVAGKSVTQGYWKNHKETLFSFKAYLANSREGPFLRTGDLGFLESGELFITGRIKDMLIIRGCNYYPQDIEQTVEESHPSLKAGAVAAFSIEEKSSERLVVIAEVERTFIRTLEVKTVIESVRQAITANHDLQVYAALLVRPGQIPKTSSGKIQRYRCRELFLSGDLAIVQDWSENPKNKREFVKIQSEVNSLLQAISSKV